MHDYWKAANDKKIQDNSDLLILEENTGIELTELQRKEFNEWKIKKMLAHGNQDKENSKRWKIRKL